ncbi:hypothetical protein Celly_0954 [Cellulophaga lytica DSM 7489]|uniref:Ankyrin n=1 Tax=Cellulophaga lytica (strain ATCC 23178 / DSM 7489 / JCM 8516 / NBRC 14961 / NCIMB 1423 / VKM B-1433 / Cy l20) TaxID=867900 RepID=F0RDN7_CELLC|nr:hypothetical protein [Cellulophaga lytica]ADY28785.1 hypothetical protein Celly_0954 [Cellulophaga lytica DSM 7489]WQG77036.1 hypothetical protein SR888_15250 [Cellulophaga lytica]
MKYINILFLLILQLITVNKTNAQCPEAQSYVSKIEQADSWTPTERVSSGDKIQAWTQLGTWYNYRCECENGGNLSDTDLQRLVDHLNMIKGQISSKYSSYGSVPSTSISDCKKKTKNGSNASSKLNNNSNSKSSTQIEMENRLVNYNKAMNLKTQGENIARAYAQQVKSYGQLNSTSTPEVLLENFNSNMQAIADLEAQNKADNLSQLSNTLSSSLNDLSTGNYEGAMFSALSLLDQGEAKREARRKAEATKRRLAYQVQQKMTAFYTKAVELNDEAINQYYEKAAYAYSKEEEAYMLAYIDNLECHKKNMENNFSYNNTSWLKNNCSVPVKKNYTVNNLVAKDIQYINAAKRKYALYKKTGEQVFQKGAMRFAGLAATENPKADYYYTMGHYAGINNPLVAYSSFLTAKSKNSNYFSGEKASEFAMVKLSLESSFKKAIEENDQEVVSNIVGAGLHQTVKIDNSLPIIYAIKIDKADVVFAFLNTDLVGKPQTVINKKVQSALYMAALLDAPNTIQKFADLGFSVDFSIAGKTPLDAAAESLSVNSFNKISELLGGQTKYNIENSDVIKLQHLLRSADVNDTIKVIDIFNSLNKPTPKYKSLELLLYAKKREGFFMVFEANKKFYADWVKENRAKIFKQFSEEVLYKYNKHVHRYLSLDLLPLADGVNLYGDDLATFFEVWLNHSWNYMSMPKKESSKSALGYDLIVNSSLKNKQVELLGIQLGTQYAEIMGITGSYKDDWNKSIMFEFITSNPETYQLNLLNFSIYYRQDSKMVRVLLDNYNNETLRSGNFLRNVIWNGPMLNPNSTANNKQQAELIKSGYEILEMLLFDFGYHKDAFKTLAQMRFETGMYPQANEYLKKLLDRLIESDQADPNWNDWWDSYSLKKNKKNIKKRDDRKYWEAVIEGNFEERY